MKGSDYLYFPPWESASMKNVTKVQSRAGSSKDYSMPVSCPYCHAITTVNRLMTESGCSHFEDFTAFRDDEGAGFCEIDETDEPDAIVCMIETTFRKDGSKLPKITRHVSGELIEIDDDFKIVVDGKTEGIITGEEFLGMMLGDEDEGEEGI